MEIAAGEYGYDIFYFRNMLSAGAVDVQQADVTRCGGITGIFAGGRALPGAQHTAFSPHRSRAAYARCMCGEPIQEPGIFPRSCAH